MLQKLEEYYPFAEKKSADRIKAALDATNLRVMRTGFLGCYLANPESVRAVAKEINGALSGNNGATAKVYIMYSASWLFPSKLAIFEIQPRYFGELDWITFLHRDAEDPHVALYGVNLSADAEHYTDLENGCGDVFKSSTLHAASQKIISNLLTTSDTIMCFWRPYNKEADRLTKRLKEVEAQKEKLEETLREIGDNTRNGAVGPADTPQPSAQAAE